MWAKSDKRQVCAFCSIGTNHTTYPSCTQSNCSDFGSTAALFSCKILKYMSIIYHSSFQPSLHILPLLFCIWCFLTHRLFVTLSLLRRSLKHHVFISFSQFCLSILHCPMSLSKLYVPGWSIYSLFVLFPIVHLLHQSYFSGLVSSGIRSNDLDSMTLAR